MKSTTQPVGNRSNPRFVAKPNPQIKVRQRFVVGKFPIQFFQSKAVKLLMAALLFLSPVSLFAGAKTWTGAVSNDWNTAGNWSPSGVPTSGDDITIASSATYPVITSGTYTIHKLIINAGTSFSFSGTSFTVKGGIISISGTFNLSTGSILTDNDLTVASGGVFNVSGGLIHLDDVPATNPTKGLIIAAGGVINQTGGTFEIKDYKASAGTFNQNGASALFKIFHDWKPGAGSVFNSNLGTVQFYGAPGGGPNFVNGTRQFNNIIVDAGINPKFDNTTGGTVPISGNFTNNNTALNVTTKATFTFNGAGTQTVTSASSGTNATFGNLVIDKPSGSVVLASNAYVAGNTTITNGTYDLSTYLSNRKSSGGALLVDAGGTMRLAATTGGQTGSNFPSNFSSISLASTSTVEYYGGNQTVYTITYGHLILTGTSGTVVKTMPSTAFTVAGNFSSAVSTATSVSYTAGNAITFGGNVSIGASTTFGAASYSHSIAGDLTNDGTLTGSTSTITMSGANKAISGNGTFNFNNLTVTGSGVTASPSAIVVAGNLVTSGAGTFTQSAGTITMSGTTKTISGSNITLNNLTVSGTVTSSSALTVTGNLAVNTSASYIMSSGSVVMSGTSKTISNSGTLTLYSLNVTGSVTTASSFTITSLLDVDGSLTASAGTVTFTGTSVLSGTANLYNVTLNGTSLQLSTDAVLGIAATYTITAGSLNTTTTTPNTVHFNGSMAQNIASGTFHHLVASNSAKTATGALTVNGDLTINASASLAASSYTHIVKGNFTNSGTFTAGTSTVQFTGTADAIVAGATTFNIVTINKSASTNLVTLQSNVSVATINMTQGSVRTGTNTLTITTTRTGNGIILGYIQRTHAFSTGVAYEFEGPYNTITFASASGVTSVLVKVTVGTVSDFPNGSAINRLYDISIPSGTYNATLRLHYEDAELNGNTESSMNIFRYSGGSWGTPTKTANSTTLNYLEQSGLTDLSMRWTLSDAAEQIASWNGSVSSNWATAANWTAVSGSPTLPPTSGVIVQIGYSAYTNAPVISSAAVAKSISFGSTVASTLSLTTSGSLTVSGNISGSWSTSRTHTLNINNQTATVNGDLILSDGTAGRAIDVNIGTGTLNVAGSVTQSGGANVVFSGAGNLNIGTDYTYSSGTFTGSTGTVSYNGSGSQAVAAVGYNNLTINKSAGQASINTATSVGGNLLISAGQLVLNAAPTVTGNVSISSGATLTSNGVTTTVGGNWTNSGTYSTSGGTVTLNGTGAQSISASNFNNLVINKSAGTATLAGNATVAGNLTVTNGSLDIATYTANRTAAGGTLTLATGTTLLLAGSNNFPSNYNTNTINSASTVNYNGTIAQTIAAKTYGNLITTNGGATAKTPAASFTVGGNLTISSGSTLNGSSYTITLNGNWSNSGTYTQSTSTVNMNGASKTITGTTTFYNATVNGSYTVSGSNITTTGLLWVATGGTLNTGAGTLTVSGGLTNNGSFISSGTVTFSGTGAQAITFSGALQTTMNTANFNGTVSPTITSTSSPTIATLNVNNTGNITPNGNWAVTTAATIASGSTFAGGSGTHTFSGSFTNSGTVTSSGILIFNPSTTQTIQLKGTTFTSTGTVKFGGTAAMTVSGSPNTLTNVIIDNSVGVTPSVAWTVAGDFTINSGKIFNASTFSHTVAGDFLSDGTLNPGTSTFTLSGTAKSLSGSTNTTFYDLVITGTITANADYNVSRNFTNNGTYDGSAGMANFTGSLASVISGSAASFAFAEVGVQKTGGATVTLAKNITSVAELDVFSGTFDQSTFTVTQDAVDGGSLWVADNATYKIGGTNTLPVFSLYTLETNSTVEYAGTTQSVSIGATYGNVSITTSGSKTAAGALNIANNFSLATGTFVAGSYTHSVGGNWTMSSGTFTNTGSKISLTGTADQTISSTGAFNNFEVNKASGNAVLATNITINGTLTFTSGKINTSSYSVIMPASGSVSGAAQGTGWVNGNLQKNVATGSNVSRTFEVGGSNYYSPVTTLFASVSTQGNLVVKPTATDHPQIGGSNLSASNSVNRYYTLTNSGIIFTTTTITFNWNSADLDGGATPLTFGVALYNGAIWSYPTSSGQSTTSIVASSVAAFGDFAIGAVCTPGTWSGSVSTSWNNASNWQCSQLPTSLINVIIPTGLSKYPVIASTDTGFVNNITINTGASVTVSGKIKIAGSITNSGTFTASDGVVEMNGSSAQVIPASAFASNNIKELVINNTAGVTVSGPVNIIDYLYINGGFINTGGYITLKSTLSNTAQIPRILSVAATPIVGNVTVERYVPGRRRYRLITSSVTTSASATLSPGQEAQSIWGNWQMAGSIASQNVGTSITGGTAADGFDQITTTASMYTYDDVNKKFVAYSSANGKNTKYTPLKAGVAYYLFVYGDRQNSASATSPRPTVLSSTGTVLTGNQTYTTSSTIPLSPVTDRYTLVGNPFAAMVDWKSVSKFNISKTIWGWDANMASTGGYVTVTESGSTVIVAPVSPLVQISRFIQPGQGFFVKTTGASPQMIIKESDKVTNKLNINSFVFRTDSASVQPMMAVNLLYTTSNVTYLADGVVAAFDNSFSNQVNEDDGKKMLGSAETVSWTTDGELLAIDARQLPGFSDTLFLHTNKLTKPQYTLQIFADGLQNKGVTATLEDKFLQTSQPLLMTDTNRIIISITSDPSSYSTDRFKIVLRSQVTLPVAFTNIKATRKDNDVVVEWEVATESGVKQYEVEKSADGISFEKTHQVTNIANNNGNASYQWLDIKPVTGYNYYRIRTVQADGSIMFSKVVSVNMNGNGKVAGIRISPNPIKGRIVNMNIQDLEKGSYSCKLYNAQGKLVFNEVVTHQGGSSLRTISLTNNLPAGIYHLQLTNDAIKLSQTIMLE